MNTITDLRLKDNDVSMTGWGNFVHSSILSQIFFRGCNQTCITTYCFHFLWTLINSEVARQKSAEQRTFVINNNVSQIRRQKMLRPGDLMGACCFPLSQQNYSDTSFHQRPDFQADRSGVNNLSDRIQSHLPPLSQPVVTFTANKDQVKDNKPNRQCPACFF